MRILSGFMPPTSGTAEIGGHDVVKESLEVRKLVGYLPETVPLYPDMTVFGYLKFMADLHKVPKAEERVNAVLELVHMRDRSKGYIGNLSKGMRQRIGLAQALVHDPQVLILDEPTIGLDPVQIIEVRKLIKEIGKQKTVLLSTHILSEAQQICNRVLIINKGRIVIEDTPEKLQTRLAGGRRVVVKVRGHAEDALPLVKNIHGIVSVSTKDEDTIIFETAANQDVRPELARVIVRSGIDLLELHAESMSLEDIFLELTRDEPASPTIARPDMEDASDEADLIEEEE
jgi:ABC-2 type transport system ATP-binding protein